MEKRTIMIVDDDEDIRIVMHEALEAVGYQVVEAESGETCLGLVNTAKPDLIILDIAMAGIDDIETFKRLGNDIAVIFHSSDESHWLGVLELGAFDFLSKPASLEDLLDTVEAALRY